jgi:plasmid stabilization system protein ParE
VKLEYTADAIDDLIRLREFIAVHDPAAAGRMAERLQSGVNSLLAHPKLGHPVTYSPEPESIRDLFIGDYLVRYLLMETKILVLRVWHQRENWK